MRIYTGNFANVKKYLQKGLYPISIAISARYFNGDVYRPLNPNRSFMMEEEKSYTPKYDAILRKLDPNKVVSDLRQLSKGKDIVLLCHEKEGDFCHRHLVAKWLNENLNMEVSELGKMQKQKPIIMQASLF